MCLYNTFFINDYIYKKLQSVNYKEDKLLPYIR